MKNWCLNNSYIISVSMFFVKKMIFGLYVLKILKNGYNKIKKI